MASPAGSDAKAPFCDPDEAEGPIVRVGRIGHRSPRRFWMVKKSGRDRTNPKQLPPGATKKEDEQLDELAAGYPWSLTVKEFLSLVEERYGVKLVEFVTR